MPTVSDLGRKIKEKHPQYADVPDEVLGLKIQARYPGAYDDFSPAGMVKPPQPKGITGAPWGTFSSGPHMSFEETVGPDSMLGKAAGAIRGVSNYLPDDSLALAVPRGTQVSTFLERARNVGATLGAAYGTTKAGEAAGLSNGWAEAIGFATGALVGTKLSPEATALLKKHGGPKGLLLDLLHGKSAAPGAAAPSAPKPFLGFPRQRPTLAEFKAGYAPPSMPPLPSPPPTLAEFKAGYTAPPVPAPPQVPPILGDPLPKTVLRSRVKPLPDWMYEDIRQPLPRPPDLPAAVSPVNPVAGPKPVRVPKQTKAQPIQPVLHDEFGVPTMRMGTEAPGETTEIPKGATVSAMPPMPTEHIPVHQKMKPVIDYSHEVRTGKNLGMAQYFHKAKITTSEIEAMTEAEYNKHIKQAGYRPSTGKGYSRPHSEAKAAVIEAIRKLREE